MDPYVFSGILTNTELNKLHKVVKLYWQRAWTQIWADFSISFSLVRKNELFFQVLGLRTIIQVGNSIKHKKG